MTNTYSISNEKILELAKKSLDEIEFIALKKYLNGKSNEEIAKEMEPYRMTPYLVWAITVRWLNHFRNEPITEPFREEKIHS